MTLTSRECLELVVGHALTGWCLARGAQYWLGESTTTALTAVLLLAAVTYSVTQVLRRIYTTHE
jgi:hypothetical protein